MMRPMTTWKRPAVGLASLLLVLHGCSNTEPQAVLLVGAAKRDITPTAQTAPPDGNVFLGGFGFGAGRMSTGVLDPIFVRAFVVSGPDGTVAFAQNETQGAFVAMKDGPYGLVDIADAVEEATEGAIPSSHVIIGSDHSHAGPDTTGVWGGLPETYLAFLRDQTVDAIVAAYETRQEANLFTGRVDAADLLRSQFDEPPNDVVDEELRVLVATAPDDPEVPFAVLVNYAAHATVMGSGNTLISGDWPSVVSAGLEEALAIDTAVVMIADVGRTQPERDAGGGEGHEARLRSYGALVQERAMAALADLRAIRGGEVRVTQRYLQEPYDNPWTPFGVLQSLISRSDAAPWLTGETIGTVVSAARIGDVLFVATPGEGYPAIQFAMQEQVDASTHFVFGVANDQLGYLIAPEEGYADVLAAAPENDNAIFNVSSRIGDHVQCSLLTAAAEIGFAVTADETRCAPYENEDPAIPGR